MKLRIVSAAACAAMFAAPAFAQSGEPDAQLNIDSVDALFGNQVVTDRGEDQSDAAEEDAAVADGDADGPATDEEAIVSEDAPAEPSDLDRAYNRYSQCVAEAAEGLAGEGFATESLGEEAILQCSGARAAYVNAFYFDQLPNYPNADESEVHATVERMVQQTDSWLGRKAAEDAGGSNE